MEEQVTDTQHITAGDAYKQEEAHAALKEQNLQANEEAESDAQEDIQQLGLQDDGGNTQIALASEKEKETLISPQETSAEDNIVEQTNNVETIGRVTENEKTEDKFTTPTVGIFGEGLRSEELKVDDNGTPSREDDDGCCESSGDTQRNEELDLKTDDISGFNNTSETTTSPNPCDKQGKEVDGLKSQHREGNQDDGAESQNAVALEKENTTVTSAQETPAENNIVQQANNVNTTGRDTEDETAVNNLTLVAVGILGGNRRLWAVAALIVLVAMLMHLLHPKSPPENSDVLQIDIFLRQLEKMKTQFPNQRPDLWKRSQIHLQRHLQTVQPTEPVSLILTAGLKGETTLRCLAHSLGSAFSSALNASVIHIDGAGKAGQDSDQVKLDIDSQLQSAFNGNKPVAVINRFEELPPGSTLIFYRYCDHENAAFKNTFLIFTILLAGEEEIPPQMCLNTVEEMVDDYLQTRFLSHDHPIAFDRMDINKYGGLWSRISHLILPVAAEAAVEHEGC